MVRPKRGRTLLAGSICHVLSLARHWDRKSYIGKSGQGQSNGQQRAVYRRDDRFIQPVICNVGIDLSSIHSQAKLYLDTAIIGASARP